MIAGLGESSLFGKRKCFEKREEVGTGKQLYHFFFFFLQGLPQTPKSGAKSCPYNGVDRSGHPPEWATTPDDDNSLVYEDGVLVSGSLQALVQHAVPTAVYYPDTAYLFAFLLSSRLFIKPHELLQRICDVGFTQQGLKGNDLSTINKEKLGRFVPHMVQLLGEWSETFPYDFRDERMMGGVRTMTHRCIALEPALRRDVTQVLHNLLNKLTQLERYEEGLAKLPAPPPSDFITQPTDITEVCQSPLVMAQQLTHIELEKLSYIGPEEFVQAFAKDNLDACYKDLKKTNNLESYIQWFNRLSYLVATHACTHVKKKQRVRVIEWWIEVARECFNIGNFNSLMGIIAGLNMSIVSRLKKTWSKVQSAKFSVLEHQMDPSSNFSSYRSTLKAAMWRSAGAVDDRQKIVIPFFSLLVKDLYFLNEGCASRLPNGHINFDKFWQLAKQVTEFMAWKQVTCPFEKVPDVINYMQTTNVLTETGLALASFECEGPENSYEKERYKNLKADTQQQVA
ncbi:ras-GEF domain-containing family member 1B-like [Palaemon carinicauda]|uniref:ras-GEF domain-containing family member 1B-like n=1 Tax=Palaemon carinicauda TaxID=392227 RepID=UPI0035B5D0A3